MYLGPPPLPKPATRRALFAYSDERRYRAVALIAEADRLWWRPIISRRLRASARAELAASKTALEALPPPTKRENERAMRQAGIFIGPR